FFQTDAGTRVNLIKITQDNLFALQPAQLASQDLATLFNKPHKNYVLSPGDILSIYLWAYPELTPSSSSVSGVESARANGYQINQEGYIQFPIIGRYKAAGKSL
ncbi:polysaccharide biosynthesis/export family protein, partial [Klebsiella pneumoniae]